MATLGTGATFTFTGFTAEATSISMSLYQRTAVDTSHLGTTNARTFIPGDLYDPGTVEIEFQVDAGDNYATPAVAAASNLVITWETGDTVTASAFVTGIDWNIPLEELQTGTISFKLAGAITISA